EEMRRIEIAEDEVGVGDGRRRAALAVAGGSGIGAGALRPDMQDAARVDAADRAAAGAQRHDVEAAQRDLVLADLAVAGERRLALDDEADIGARPAHVEGDEVAVAEELRRVAAAGDAAR